ncbi:hypothetical protein ABZ743_32775 [Streptomyces sp. NPDC006662]|uniref:hypothetical protein n=1 Tax=Streptomyces sp. NPDC006662 TaxID=3156902 RepID=UPI0033C558D6
MPAYLALRGSGAGQVGIQMAADFVTHCSSPAAFNPPVDGFGRGQVEQRAPEQPVLVVVQRPGAPGPTLLGWLLGCEVWAGFHPADLYNWSLTGE